MKWVGGLDKFCPPPDKRGRALKIEFREFMSREPCRQIFLSVHFAPLNDADWVRLTPSRERRRVASGASCREEADLGFGAPLVVSDILKPTVLPWVLPCVGRSLFRIERPRFFLLRMPPKGVQGPKDRIRIRLGNQQEEGGLIRR